MSYNPGNPSVAALLCEVTRQFGQVMNSCMEARMSGDPLKHERAVTRGISGFNKARDRCYTGAFGKIRQVDNNKVKRMEGLVKQETGRYCNNALKKVKE